MDGFHVSDGLYFKRLRNGTVKVTKRSGSKPTADILFTMTIDKDSWASVIAATSKEGETAVTFRLAQHLHAGKNPLQKVFKAMRPKEEKVLREKFGIK